MQLHAVHSVTVNLGMKRIFTKNALERVSAIRKREYVIALKDTLVKAVAE
jgi:hypothetical protein